MPGAGHLIMEVQSDGAIAAFNKDGSNTVVTELVVLLLRGLDMAK